ncbi:hypothetical protein FACS1894109_12260 [Spirochaetia bacterium]|nr:hypothetical protein FACS1894109_12260 [Spirochaetia bacterium]
MGEAKEYKNYFEFADGSCWFIKSSDTQYQTIAGFVNQSAGELFTSLKD